jgi:hypothetical protein
MFASEPFVATLPRSQPIPAGRTDDEALRSVPMGNEGRGRHEATGGWMHRASKFGMGPALRRVFFKPVITSGGMRWPAESEPLRSSAITGRVVEIEAMTGARIRSAGAPPRRPKPLRMLLHIERWERQMSLSLWHFSLHANSSCVGESGKKEMRKQKMKAVCASQTNAACTYVTKTARYHSTLPATTLRHLPLQFCAHPLSLNMKMCFIHISWTLIPAHTQSLPGARTPGHHVAGRTMARARAGGTRHVGMGR